MSLRGKNIFQCITKQSSIRGSRLPRFFSFVFPFARNDRMGFLLVGLLMSSVANASLISSKLGYDNYKGWNNNDQLYYSTFNSGEQWKGFKTPEYTVESLNLVDQINLCFAYKGGWNHYFNDCVIDEEDQLVAYLEAVEDAERFGFHFSAPAYQPETEEDFTMLDPATLDWSHYAEWSPEKQLYFSSIGQGETEGEIIPWSLD